MLEFVIRFYNLFTNTAILIWKLNGQMKHTDDTFVLVYEPYSQMINESRNGNPLDKC